MCEHCKDVSAILRRWEDEEIESCTCRCHDNRDYWKSQKPRKKKK